MNEEWPPWMIIMAEDPVLRGVLSELLQQPDFRQRLEGALGGKEIPVRFADWGWLSKNPQLPRPSDGAVGTTFLAHRPDSTLTSAAVAIDVDRIHEVMRQDSARARDGVRDALIHEFAHLIPPARTGHMRDKLDDPAPGKGRNDRQPIMVKENELRGLFGLQPRRTYGLLGDQ